MRQTKRRTQQRPKRKHGYIGDREKLRKNTNVQDSVKRRKRKTGQELPEDISSKVHLPRKGVPTVLPRAGGGCKDNPHDQYRTLAAERS